jgi:hypothetical protein
MQMANTPEASPPRLLDQVRDRIRVKHYSIPMEMQYNQGHSGGLPEFGRCK